MVYEFVLTMDDLVVDGTSVDQCIISWRERLGQEQIMEYSHQWLNTQNFLTRRMIGLQRVGESSLTIEPIEQRSAPRHF